MTRQKDLKRRIRERMLATGESYTTARLHVLRGRPELAATMPAQPTRSHPPLAGPTEPPPRLRLPRARTPALRPSRLSYAGPVFVILLFIIVGLTGCTDARVTDHVTVTDSAGIDIVVNEPGSLEAADQWLLGDSPAVVLGGGIDPATPLYRITDVAPLDGDRVAVAVNAPPQVLVFDGEGALAATLGGSGSGPGEYASVESVVWLAGDSIAVWDPDRRRVSIFSADGRLGRELDASDVAPVSARAAPSSTVPSGYTHLLSSGPQAFVIFGEGALAPGMEPGIGRPALPAVRISTTGDAIAEYGTVPGMEMMHGGPAGTLPLPLGARTDAATSDELLIVATGETTQFSVFGLDGSAMRVVRWPDSDRAVGGEWLDDWTAMVEAAPRPVRGLVDASLRRELFPATDGLLASDDGYIMVGEYAGPIGIWPLRRADEGPEALAPVRRPRERRWLVFDLDGVLTATLRTPEGFAPTAVRHGRIWGVFTDSLNIESVHAYSVIR